MLEGDETRGTLTLEDAQAIKTLQDGVGQLHILGKRKRGIVPTADGVGGRDHRTPVIDMMGIWLVDVL